MKNSPIPPPPSIDRNDPAAIKSATTVAKRRNNEIRRKVPLLADQIPLVTVEDVFQQRELGRARSADVLGQVKAHEERMVSPEEYATIEAKQDSMFGPRWAFWTIIKGRIEKRQEPMTDEEDVVLAILQTWEGEAPTPYELHRRCGDGLTPQQIRVALDSLMQRELVAPNVGRKCTVSELPFVGTYKALVI